MNGSGPWTAHWSELDCVLEWTGVVDHELQLTRVHHGLEWTVHCCRPKWTFAGLDGQQEWTVNEVEWNVLDCGLDWTIDCNGPLTRVDWSASRIGICLAPTIISVTGKTGCLKSLRRQFMRLSNYLKYIRYC